MQANASVWIATWGTIFQVAFYGESYLCQLASNLVVAARMQLYLQKKIALAGCYEPVVQYGFLGVGNLAIIGLGGIRLLVAGKPVCQGAALLWRLVADNGPVCLLYLLVLGKEFVQAGPVLSPCTISPLCLFTTII